jgi:acyl-CoA reductase-like NAD-dependent aldehyde dehydrogenase
MSSAAASLIHGAMLIDGAATAGDTEFEVRDPGRTGDVVAIVAGGSASHADAAVDAARRAGDDWRRRPVTDRIQALAGAAAAVEQQTELPVVVRDIAPGAELVSVEQFGPVVPLVAYDTDAEAVRYANDSEYGLCSSVWSGDPQRAVGLARQIEAGATFINSHNLPSVSFDMPFGGVKQSGLGRERTELGFQEYVEEHAIRFVK